MNAHDRTAPQTVAGQIADPIAMEVFSNRMLTITEEMGNTLIRSSFSTNIKERKDCSVGLFDRHGRLVAQASHIPLHLGSLRGSVRAVLDRFPAETIRPGSAFISNDPYLAGGTHTPDISIVTPMFAGASCASSPPISPIIPMWAARCPARSRPGPRRCSRRVSASRRC